MTQLQDSNGALAWDPNWGRCDCLVIDPGVGSVWLAGPIEWLPRDGAVSGYVEEGLRGELMLYTLPLSCVVKVRRWSNV